jgi:hypothetical protein
VPDLVSEGWAFESLVRQDAVLALLRLNMRRGAVAREWLRAADPDCALLLRMLGGHASTAAPSAVRYAAR